jgi:hypothetical protein
MRHTGKQDCPWHKLRGNQVCLRTSRPRRRGGAAAVAGRISHELADRVEDDVVAPGNDDVGDLDRLAE